MDRLDAAETALPALLHGEGGSVRTMVHEAARCGFSTRVGPEDGLHLPDGTVATSNAALVSAAFDVPTRRQRVAGSVHRVPCSPIAKRGAGS